MYYVCIDTSIFGTKLDRIDIVRDTAAVISGLTVVHLMYRNFNWILESAPNVLIM